MKEQTELEKAESKKQQAELGLAHDEQVSSAQLNLPLTVTQQDSLDRCLDRLDRGSLR